MAHVYECILSDKTGLSTSTSEVTLCHGEQLSQTSVNAETDQTGSQSLLQSVTISGGRPPLPSFMMRDWWWEILSWIIGTLSLVSLIVLIIIFKDKSFAVWHSRLSINAIVSALAQTAQSSLAVSLAGGISQLKWDWLRRRRHKKDIETFDLASRGPLGSLLLIWDQVVRQREIHLTLLGASITVLLIAFSTFAQQAISIGERKVHSNGAAEIARVRNFTAPVWMSGVFTDDSAIPRWVIAHATINGFTRTGISLSEVQAKCSGESCLWEKYTSLGVCAYTHPEETVGFTGKFDEKLGDYTYRINLPVTVGPGYNVTYLERIAQLTQESESFWTSEFGRVFRTWSPIVGGNAAYSQDVGLGDSADIYLSLARDPTYGAATSVSDVTITFVKVTLNICTHTYNTTVQSQQTDTKLLRKGPALSKDPQWRRTPEKGALEAGLDDEGCGVIGGLSACLHAVASLVGHLVDMLIGHTDLYGGVEEGQKEIIEVLFREIMDGGEKIATRIENVATSLTNALRLSPNGTEIIEGVVETTERYFRTEIQWLILPITLWLFASIFLLATIWLTDRHHVPIWKSSPLVLLDCKWSTAPIDSSRLARKRLEKVPTTVTIEPKELGWRLDEIESTQSREMSSGRGSGRRWWRAK